MVDTHRNIKQSHYYNAKQLKIIFSINHANILIQNKKKAPESGLFLFDLILLEIIA